MNKLTLALAIATVAAVSACTPTNTPPSPATTTTSTTIAPGRKRRSAEEEVSITIVTNKQFDEKTHDLNMAAVEAVLEDYKTSQGIKYDSSKLHKETKNQSGKFAVAYSTSEDCERVKQFVKNAKASSNQVAYAMVKCPQQPLTVL